MVGDNLGASSAYWTTWSFDAVGNRTSQDQHSTTGGADTTTTYSYNGNGAGQPDTLTSTNTTGASGTSSTSYAYDAAGNMTSRNAGQGNQTLTWNDAGLLASITGGSGGTSSYVYDADGNLLLREGPRRHHPVPAGRADHPQHQQPAHHRHPATTSCPAAAWPTAPAPATRTASRSPTSTAPPFLTLDNTAPDPTWRQFTPYGAPRGPAVHLGRQPRVPQQAHRRQHRPDHHRRPRVRPHHRPVRQPRPGPGEHARKPQRVQPMPSDNPITNSDPTGLMLCADRYLRRSVPVPVAHSLQRRWRRWWRQRRRQRRRDLLLLPLRAAPVHQRCQLLHTIGLLHTVGRPQRDLVPAHRARLPVACGQHGPRELHPARDVE